MIALARLGRILTPAAILRTILFPERLGRPSEPEATGAEGTAPAQGVGRSFVIPFHASEVARG